MQARRPRVFVGSSVAGVPISKVVQLQLGHQCDVTVWDQDVFTLTSTNLASLIHVISDFDFGVLVLTPDDHVVDGSGTRVQAPRDNVIFEAGLFMGRLGPARTFIVCEEGAKLKLPTDLAGVSMAEYRPFNQADPQDMQSKLGPACTRIELAIGAVGVNRPTITIPDGLGIRRLYFGPTSSSLRNEAKRQAFERAKGEVFLLAHSGHAFLASHGCHRESVERFLETGRGRFIVILLNPLSTSAIELCLNWLRAYAAQSGNLRQRRVIKEFLPQKTKLMSSLHSYSELRKEYGDRIELRLTSFDSGCSILWLPDVFFLEPYYRSNPYDRARKHLSTYEVELGTSTVFAEMVGKTGSNTHIDFFHRYSVPFERWLQYRSALLQAAMTNLDLMHQTEEISQDEARCLKGYLAQVVDD